MPNFSPDWLRQHEAKQRGRHPVQIAQSKAVEKESVLQDDIEAFCRRQGWICLRNPMHLPTHRMPGEPDLDIIAINGVRLWIECKAKGGKLSAEQLGFHAWAQKLGHQVEVVTNLEQFHGLMLDLTKEVWE